MKVRICRIWKWCFAALFSFWVLYLVLSDRKSSDVNNHILGDKLAKWSSDGKYVLLTGNPGSKQSLQLPTVGFGTAALSNPTETVLDAANIGYRFFDTAGDYGPWYHSEIPIGKLWKLFSREDFFVSTKLHPQFHGRKNSELQIDLSLQNMETSYIDLFLIHFPVCWGDLCDPKIEIEGNWKDSWRTMEEMYKKGKIRFIGVSNFNIGELEDLWAYAKVKPFVLQSWFDPFHQDNDLRSQWVARGYKNPVFSSPVLLEIAKYHKKSVSQIVLRWAHQLNIVVIPRSQNLDHMKENLSILDFSLNTIEMKQIANLDGTKQKRDVEGTTVDN